MMKKYTRNMNLSELGNELVCLLNRRSSISVWMWV